MPNVEVAYILGAGFSKYAGLPLQSQFTEELLRARQYEEGPSKALVEFLSGFIYEVFDHSKKAEAKYWPALEDIFTCIDLSANTGHHLGVKYPPSLLRTVRRALIARITRMLYQRYAQSRKDEDTNWGRLQRFFATIDPHRSAFVNLNWDTVVEAQLEAKYGQNVNFTYTGDAIAAVFPDNRDTVSMQKRSGHTFRLIKVHGSVNWLYCDNCRRLFWFPSEDVIKVGEQALTSVEWEVIKEATGRTERYRGAKWKCPVCNVLLGGRIATFSFRKALDFPMFQKSWFHAERVLRQAKTWVFIGYSLPAADYEFKYLLKRIQLSRQVQPDFLLVADGGADTSNPTYRNYQGFFGRGIQLSANCYLDGITWKVIARLKALCPPET
ncbi:MAG: hypothetical protein ABSF46_16290 [Terriglobia bacterium]